MMIGKIHQLSDLHRNDVKQTRMVLCIDFLTKQVSISSRFVVVVDV